MKVNEKSRKIISIFNENKLVILKTLYECEKDLCGCQMVEKLHIAKNLLSYHIRSLEKNDLIVETRCGKNKKYKIKPDHFEKVKEILKIVELI